MADKRDTFEADEISVERKAAKSNIKMLTEEKASRTEKAPASDVFSGVLEKREKREKRMQLLLTEENAKILADVSKKTGRSKNDLINRLISTLGENTDL